MRVDLRFLGHGLRDRAVLAEIDRGDRLSTPEERGKRADFVLRQAPRQPRNALGVGNSERRAASDQLTRRG